MYFCPNTNNYIMEKIKEKGWLLIILGGLWLLCGSIILIYNGIEAKRAASSMSEAAKSRLSGVAGFVGSTGATHCACMPIAAQSVTIKVKIFFIIVLF